MDEYFDVILYSFNIEDEDYEDYYYVDNGMEELDFYVEEK
jgi:hypothetical protein